MCRSGSRTCGPPCAGNSLSAQRMSFYITTAIYYVNGAPHLGPRLRDDRDRRARAPHAPARRGRVLPHRHRRARRAGRRRGRRPQGIDAPGAGRPQRRALQGAGCRSWTSPTTSSSAPPTPQHEAASRRCCSASTTTATRYKGALRGLVLPALRRLQGRERDPRGQPLPDPRDRRSTRESGGELVLPALALPGAARGALRRPPRLRDAAGPLQRGARRSSARACRTSR